MTDTLTRLRALRDRWQARAKMAARCGDGGSDAIWTQCADRLDEILADAGWQLPPGAGICADDLDECTITLALSSEAEVREARAKLPSRNRGAIYDEDAARVIPPPPPPEEPAP